MTALLAFFAGPARLKGLLIGAAALVLIALSLTTWALIERAWRLQDEVELATLRAQQQVLADSLGRCSAGTAAAKKAGDAATAETKRLLEMASRAMERTQALRDEIRETISRPPPTRPDGKPKDCTDALGEIRAKVKP